MILTEELKKQTIEYFTLLEEPLTLLVNTDNSPKGKELDEFIHEICSLTDKINYKNFNLEYTPSFAIKQQNQENFNIQFAGIPLGHEYSSFILALLQVSGVKPKISNDQINAINQITTPLYFKTYASLSCHNCPDVVQAFNMMSVINPNIHHIMIDGAIFQKEVEQQNIMAVPATILNDEIFLSGKNDLDDILEKLNIRPTEHQNWTDQLFDMVIVGGGPSGVASAIYGARKGLKIGLLTKEIGGQINETSSIENIIGIPYTEGINFVNDLKTHLSKYDNIQIIKHLAVNIQKQENILITLDNQQTITTKTAIISTGAKWRKLNIPGEQRLAKKGVAYCPHCDAPLFKNKNVAVIGGGNSGVEAAIDLAQIANNVTLLEFAPQLKADQILVDRATHDPKIKIITNAKTTEIAGDNQVEKLVYEDLTNNEEQNINLDGVFIQIGLKPNTDWLNNTEIKQNQLGEIIVDEHQKTNIDGIFAAGDCTNSPYKQIIISMGTGATAALAAFDYLIRN